MSSAPRMPPGHVRPISLDREDLAELREEALWEGFLFLERMKREWDRVENCFAGAGEILLGAFEGERLVGVGGLNRDPYAEAPGIARLRHLYVLPANRRRGIGRGIVCRLLARAEGTFVEIRLRTDRSGAAAFYERLGFEPSSSSTATHSVRLASAAGRHSGFPSPRPFEGAGRS